MEHSQKSFDELCVKVIAGVVADGVTRTACHQSGGVITARLCPGKEFGPLVYSTIISPEVDRRSLVPDKST